MKKILFILVTLLSISTCGFAQRYTYDQDVYYPMNQHFQRISVGVHGGIAQAFDKADNVVYNLGYTGVFDLQYATYWRNKNFVYLGFLVGASANYLNSGVTKRVLEDKRTVQTDNGQIDYTISASNINEKQNQIMVEVPIMFALMDKSGFFMNIGPRFEFPVWSDSKVTYDKSNIDAYFPVEGIHVKNELITGKLQNANDPVATQYQAPWMNIRIGLDMGYEFQCYSGNRVGLGIYMDYQVASFSKATTYDSFIELTPPSNQSPATVTLHSPAEVYGSKASMFAVGLKLIYHFQIVK